MSDELRHPPPDAARSQRIALAALGLALTVLGAYILQGFLRALAWGGIFALAMWPLYCRARRAWPARRHDIGLPTIFTLVVILVFLVPLVAVGIEIGREGASVVRLLLEYQRTGIPLPDFVRNLPVAHLALADWWQANLSDPANLSSLVGRINRDHVLAYSESVGTRVLHQGVTSVFTLLTLFFLLRDGGAINDQLHRAVTRTFGARGAIMCAQATASVRATVDGLVLVGIGEGVVIGIGYWVTGVPHPTLFGGLTAVAAMVPFGAPLVFGVAALILLVHGSLVFAIALFILGVVVTFVADHFVRPAIIGGATRLPFFWVLLGILGGVETFGVIGLFVGPVVMSVLIQLWRDWLQGAIREP
jgi:predicted PurR-regulated permease PerM